MNFLYRRKSVSDLTNSAGLSHSGRMQPNDVEAANKKRILLLRTDLWHFKQDRYFADWAHALQNCGHEVFIVTCGYYAGRCHPDINKFPIIHVGTSIPRGIFGWFKHILYLLRSAYCAAWVAHRVWHRYPDLVINCTNPITLPILHKLGGYRTVHIMNFSETMTGKEKRDTKLIKPWYYKKCLESADEIIVETRSARDIFERSFSTTVWPKVCYPCVDVGVLKTARCCALKEVCADAPEGGGLFVCFGNMRASSNFELAIDAFQLAMGELTWETRSTCHLILAGHVSDEYPQNVSYYQHLQRYAMKLKFGSYISVIKRLPVYHRKTIIRKCLAVVQTSMVNHTNCRPILEAMYFGKTIIATDVGVYKELLYHRVTGYVLKPHPKKFAMAMYKLIKHKMLAMNSGFLCEVEYKRKYNFQQFSKRVRSIVYDNTNGYDGFIEVKRQKRSSSMKSMENEYLMRINEDLD